LCSQIKRMPTAKRLCKLEVILSHYAAHHKGQKPLCPRPRRVANKGACSKRNSLREEELRPPCLVGQSVHELANKGAASPLTGLGLWGPVSQGSRGSPWATVLRP
jgi:hypothetical protein